MQQKTKQKSKLPGWRICNRGKKMVRYINCENAKNAEAKMVMNFFSQYEMENELPGTTDTYYFGTADDMLDFAHTRTDYRVYHYEMYLREINPESGVAYGWNKVEGGYSKGYYEMVAVAR